MCHQLTREHTQQPQLSPSTVAARLAGHRAAQQETQKERARQRDSPVAKSKRSPRIPHIRANENLLCSSNSLDDGVDVVVVVVIVVVVVVVQVVFVVAAARHNVQCRVLGELFEIPILSRHWLIKLLLCVSPVSILNS